MLDHSQSQIALELVWRATWQSAALAFIVVAVMFVARKQIAPSWRVVLWAIPLCRLALLVLPPSSMSLFNLVELNALATNVSATRMPPTIQKSDLPAPSNELYLPLTESISDTPQVPLRSNPSQPKPSQQVAPGASFERTEAATADIGILFDNGTVTPATRTSAPATFRILFNLWIVGCLCSLVYYLVNRLRLTRVLSHATPLDRDDIREHISARRKALGIRRHIKCLLIDDEVGPASTGLLRPKILIPRYLLGELNFCQLCSIVDHEIQHIRRFDSAFLLLSQVACCLHWFNPLAYWLAARVRVEMEHAVDAATVGQADDQAKRSYGDLLIHLAGRRSRFLGFAPMADRRSNLKQRIEELLAPVSNSRLRSAFCLAAILLLAVTGLSEVAITQQSTESESASNQDEPTMETKAVPPILIAGKVVDAQGNPVKGAVVAIYRPRSDSPVGTTVSDRDGKFNTTIVATQSESQSMHIECKSSDGSQMGYLALRSSEKKLDWSSLDLRLDIVKKARLIVLDGAEKPIAGASVLAKLGSLSGRRISTTTDESGYAELTYTNSERIAVAVAKKDHLGLDYHLYRLAQRGFGPEFPEDAIERFKLDGASPVKLRMVDELKRPLEGVHVYPLMLQKSVITNSSLTPLNLAFFYDAISENSDANGEVTFKWMPSWQKGVVPLVTSGIKSVVHAQVSHDPRLERNVSEVELELTVPIRGKVIGVDGKPAKGIAVEAHGIGYSYSNGRATTETDDLGNYELFVAPNQIYLVVVKDGQWVSSPHDGFAVFKNTPVEGKDFTLRKPTRVFGTVRSTELLGLLAVPNHRISLDQIGKGLSELGDIQLAKPTLAKELRPGYDKPIHSYGAWTDDKGNFEFFVGDGTYVGRDSGRNTVKKFVVSGEEAIEMNFEVPTSKPPFHDKSVPFQGLVIENETGKVVRDCAVTVVPQQVPNANDRQLWEATTDANGKFQGERMRVGSFVHAISHDRTMAAIRKINDDEDTISLELQLVGSARGCMISPDGSKPIANQEIKCGFIVPSQEGFARGVVSFGFGNPSDGSLSFVENATTDADGNFKFKHLVPGVEYRVYVGSRIDLKAPWFKLKVEKGESRDLGKIKAPKQSK